jgi:general secretion pathway protein G
MNKALGSTSTPIIAPTIASRGFTLLEILVVLAIIGIILGLVGPRLFGVLDSKAPEIANTQVKLLRGAIETFRLDVGRYPTTQEGLNALVAKPSDPAIGTRWRGPYTSEPTLPVDPWKNPYQYSVPGANGQPFSLYSMGSDGKRGGESDAADIGILPPN